MQYLSQILIFITGGGLFALLNWKLKAKTDKVDYADKAIKFMDELNDKYTVRINDLEARIEALEKIICKKS